MSATASSPPDGAGPARVRRVPGRVLIPAWAGFAALNLWLMFVLPGLETIPFHLVWLSLAVVYGLTTWRVRTMVVTLAVLSVVTFVALRHYVDAGSLGREELAEVPLTAAIFLAMVWHLRRRQAALSALEGLAATERDRAEAEQLLVRLVSHEMRTPITVARGYTELIQSSARDPQAREDSAIVLDELARLDRSTRRLATLALPERPADLSPVDLDRLLEHAARRWAPTADRRWRVDSAAGTALLDPERLRTALDCLLENAVTYTAGGDRIELRGRRDGDQVVVEVADGGAGIPPADLGGVFDQFRRGGNATGRDGAGLGLSIVRRIAEAAGGSAAVASRLGAGTTVTLRLPAGGKHRDGVATVARSGPEPGGPRQGAPSG